MKGSEADEEERNKKDWLAIVGLKWKCGLKFLS